MLCASRGMKAAEELLGFFAAILVTDSARGAITTTHQINASSAGPTSF